MAVSTVKLNGTTLMTVNDTTATASDVAQAKYFYGADGVKTLGTATGGGGGDVDMPIFTFVYDDNWETVISSTCNKTYAECSALLDQGVLSALEVDKNESGTEEYTNSLALMSSGYPSDFVYSALSTTTPIYDIHYSSNGTISIVSPSVYTETLNITQNGTYYKEFKDITEINVNVPTPTPTLVTKTITQNGTYNASSDNADGYSSVTVNVSGGGGGASNIVTGTFTGTTTGAAMDINLPYTGNGYPIAVMIFPTEGPYNDVSGTFYSLLQRYAAQAFVAIKSEATTTPTYSSGMNNAMTGMSRYKNSDTNATIYTQTAFSGTTYILRDQEPTNNASGIVRLRSSTRMSVFIADTSYGFAANIEYTYHVIYSS